mmetsp:Transcript_10094/g.25253  ORF Transcript_10094/g.25253 Transcript_10094/m.25253 type:complete len:430 (+) Transcript_10094:1568-2857(+)
MSFTNYISYLHHRSLLHSWRILELIERRLDLFLGHVGHLILGLLAGLEHIVRCHVLHHLLGLLSHLWVILQHGSRFLHELGVDAHGLHAGFLFGTHFLHHVQNRTNLGFVHVLDAFVDSLELVLRHVGAHRSSRAASSFGTAPNLLFRRLLFGLFSGFGHDILFKVFLNLVPDASKANTINSGGAQGSIGPAFLELAHAQIKFPISLQQLDGWKGIKSRKGHSTFGGRAHVFGNLEHGIDDRAVRGASGSGNQFNVFVVVVIVVAGALRLDRLNGSVHLVLRDALHEFVRLLQVFRRHALELFLGFARLLQKLVGTHGFHDLLGVGDHGGIVSHHLHRFLHHVGIHVHSFEGLFLDGVHVFHFGHHLVNVFWFQVFHLINGSSAHVLGVFIGIKLVLEPCRRSCGGHWRKAFGKAEENGKEGEMKLHGG